MKQTIIIIIAIITLCFIACDKINKRIYYYDSGELELEYIPIQKDTSIEYYKRYYKNGILAEEGTILRDGRTHGFWKEYFDDGDLKFISEYDSGRFLLNSFNGNVPDLSKRDAYIKFENSDKIEFKDLLYITTKADTLYFRTYVDSVNDHWYNVLRHRSNKPDNPFYRHLKKNKDKESSYPYSLPIESRPDTVELMYTFPDENGAHIIGKTPYRQIQLVIN